MHETGPFSIPAIRDFVPSKLRPWIIIAFVIELGMQPTDLRLFTAITVAAALSIPNIQGKAITLFRPRRVSAGCAVQSK